MNRDSYCLAMAKFISENQNTEVTSIQVSEQLLLVELGREPTNSLIGTYIKKNRDNKLI